MKTVSACMLFLAAGIASVTAAKDGPNPLSQAIALLGDLATKVTEEGKAELKAYNDYMDFCTEKMRNLDFSIETETKELEELKATIEKKSADITTSGTKIDELAASLAADEKALSDATATRKKEAAEFEASEAELLETIDVVSRAITILSREMAKNPASFAQVNAMNMNNILGALRAVVDAAGFSTIDKQKLVALVQARSSSDDADDDEDPGAPAAAAYKTHSTSIVEVLEDLKEKAEEELAGLRKAEADAGHNYAMLKLSLEDDMAYGTKGLEQEKGLKAGAEGDKASAEGDLSETTKVLANDEKDLAETNSTCASMTADHLASVKATAEELAAIAAAKNVLEEKTAGAEAQEYSFLQLQAQSKFQAHNDLAHTEVLDLLKKLAVQHHSKSLAQLASRVSALIRYGSSNGDDPFAKVKGLITEMIERLQAEAGAEATEKEYCDENMAKTKAKKAELTAVIDKFTAKIDLDASASAKLKTEVKELESALAELAKEQAEMDTLRSEQHAAYLKAKADYTSGLEGVRTAITILTEYYGSAASASLLQGKQEPPPTPEFHSKSTSAGAGIIEVLEVVEADFAKSLTLAETEEAEQAEVYEKTTQENKVTKVTKDADVKYKTQEYTTLDKAIAEITADRESVSEQLSAVLEFEEKLTERCVAKPETYASRKARRDAEIKGLKEALEVLENETAFVQRRKREMPVRSHFLA